MASRAFRSVGGGSNSYVVLNATFDDVDEQGTPFPVLAEAIPQLGTDSWRVLPDGAMETTYRLKQGLVWHDGAPLDAADFVFAWQVYANPASGIADAPPVGEMAEIVAPDSLTVLIRWRRPYPDAATMFTRQQRGFSALPRHILDQPYSEGDFEAFSNHPFWTDQYVGLGPYRLERWARGQELDMVAFDRFALGRPKIDRLRVLIANDANAAVANLLSGNADIAIDYVLQYADGATLQERWAAGKEGTVLFNPTLIWIGQFQFRPEMRSTPLLADVRLRRAMVHGMDKHGLNDALMGGTGLVIDSYLHSKAAYHPAVEAAITKYPFDRRRAQQLLDEMGLGRGADGFYADPEGRPFTLEVVGLVAPAWESELAIILDGYRNVGLNAEGRLIPAALFGDGQARATFGAMHLTGTSGFERGFGNVLRSAVISRPENRWQGSNRGGWSNAEFDRLWDLYTTTLDPTTRIQQLVQMEKLFTEEVPAIPMYYQPTITAYLGGLKGPTLRISAEPEALLRIWEWEWQ